MPHERIRAVAGIFKFSTVTDDCEIVNITEGRFDMKYIS